MKCDQCDRPAIVHQVIISNGTHRETHLCELHAAEAGVPNPSKQPVHQLLAKVAQKPKPTGLATCPGCGATLAKIRKTSLFGCPQCYDIFEEAAGIMIESAQAGATRHVGRVPGGAESDEARRHESRRLVEELDRAVHAEQYERAAELKSRLSQLDNQHPHADREES
ncbi:MAG: UvrB/UvrC motif-containing protein [Phycisphaerales bacterium]|jgi:protein arginine kinase activator|nr:UvrB/UvrC motif-containing protein [Phycisphaerales bacterium]